MAHLLGFNIGKRARILASALVLGTMILSAPIESAAAAPAKRDDLMCTMEYYNDQGDWQIDFYLPGERYRGFDRYAVCYEDNGWGEPGWDDGGPIDP